MISVPIWTAYFITALFFLLVFSLWKMHQAESKADVLAHYSYATTKGLMLAVKQHSIYVANCYLDQSEDVSLRLKPDSHGVTILLQKNKDLD